MLLVRMMVVERNKDAIKVLILTEKIKLKAKISKIIK